MERRTLLAIVLVLLVLAANQVFFNQFMRAKRKHAPPPTTEPAPGTATATGETPAPGGSTAPAPGGAGLPETAVPDRLSAGAEAEAVPGSARSMGEALTGLHVAAAPRIERTVRGDGFDATFDSEGGSISHWVLTRHRDPVRRTPQVDLVPSGSRALQVVVRTGFGEFDFARVPFQLAAFDSSTGSIDFVAQDSSGLRVEKRYRLSPDRRLFDLEVKIAAPPELGPLSYRLGWAAPLPITEQTAHIQDHQGVAYLGEKLVTAPTVQRGKEKKDRRVESGNVRWAGQRTRYFLAAVIPDSSSVEEAVLEYQSWSPPPLPDVRLPSQDLVAATAWLAGGAPPGTHIVRKARIYAGPLRYERLQAMGAGLEVAVNLGWKWLVPLSVLLLKLLNILYRVIPNYGVAIVILSAATKLIFYPLTQSSLRTMKVMHRLQPEVEAIKEKHKGDPQKMNQAMMNLYKEHKVNPLGGCLPMVLQIPVFFALYNVLLFSIELRAAPFLGYIQDLSAPDLLTRVGGFPVHLMPFIMTASSYVMQLVTPVDPRQKMTMYLMPLMMLVFLYSFPSGVIIYWTVNNLLSALQQFLVNRAEDRKLSADTP
jgi:YidC/Oxa1 family membrane protein insertase